MSNQFRTLAEMHKQMNPADPRSLEVLETHYSNLAHKSPLGGAFSAIIAQDKAVEAAQFSEVTVDIALASASKAATPRCIPHCPVCDKPAPPMPLTEYLRKGGPVCCGVKTTLGS